MKIKKIYIQNFKGIKDKKIIELEDITFLTWPNGFWKTTIFDVIELCLTWEIYRITEQKDTSWIISKKSNMTKSFYQNTENKEVLLKLLIELNNGEKKIIISYDDNSELKRKPATPYFDRFIEDYIDDSSFENLESWFSNKIKARELEELLWLERKLEVKDIYKLFNYLQQEETTFFLKQKEYDRHQSLGFLFQTTDEEKEKNKIEDFSRKITWIINILGTKVEDLKNKIKEQKDVIDDKEQVGYKSFFDKDFNIIASELNFDNEILFNEKLDLDINKKKKNKYIENLTELKLFLEKVDVNEYHLWYKEKRLRNIRTDDNFINYFILQKFDTIEEYKKLEEYNNIYNISKKENYLEFLIYEKFLISKEYEILKEKSFLYSLCSNDDYKYNITYFVLQDKINDEKYLEEWKIKDNLFKYNGKDNKLLDKFLLNKFDSEVEYIKKEYNFYKNIYNDKEFLLVKWLMFFNIFKKDDFWESRYTKLAKLSRNYNYFKSYKTEKNKIDLFKSVFEGLKIDNEKLLLEFNSNIKRKKELENDLSDNQKITTELNNTRKGLLNYFKSNVNDFDNTCILCGTKEVNKQEIKDINDLQKFIDIKTEKISKLSIWKSKELEDVNDSILNNILELEKEINLYLDNEENRKDILLFDNINEYLTQKEFDENFTLINDLLEDNNKFEIDNFDLDILKNLIKKAESIRDNLLSKYKDWYNLNKKLTYAEIERKDKDIDFNKNILKKFLNNKNIPFNIEKKGFDEIKYEKTKNEIITTIKQYLVWFDREFYVILKKFKDSNKKEIYKNNTEKLNLLLWKDKEKFLIEINDYEFNKELPIFESRLKEYVMDNTLDSFNLFNKIKYLYWNNDLVIEKELESLKNILVNEQINYPKLELVGDYNEDYTPNSILILKEKLMNLLKNKIYIFDSLKELKQNNNYINFQTSITLLKEYKIKNIEKYILSNYDEYENIMSIRSNLGNTLDLEEKAININQEKLWWDYKEKFNTIFGKDLTLVQRYKSNLRELNEKQKYIEYKYFELENYFFKGLETEYNILNERLKKLKKLGDKTTNLIEIYEKQIREYQRKMVEKIQKPFFLYTAKILQNYQQWMWIYIHFKWNNKNWDGKKNQTIVFYTDWKSNNDAMHHLSSGQLAVISVAFTLSINKSYKVSNELKFLNIDDPVQEMDSLNVHSFIELMRHNFMDYKFIISTHNDEIAYFMKYKLEKIKENSVKMINVQSEFFGED